MPATLIRATYLPDFVIQTPLTPSLLRIRVAAPLYSTGYALAGKGMDTRRLQHFLGHSSITNTVRYTAMSPEPFKDIWR